MIRALVLGGATCVWRDLDQIRQLAEFQVIIAVNSAIAAYPGRIDHAVSFHAELFPHWSSIRRGAGRPDAGAYWSVRGHVAPPGLSLCFVAQWGGSSGMIAAQVGMRVADRVILCGVPMEPDGEHFDKAGTWKDAIQYRPSWQDHFPDLRQKVRSMSGWTADLLGRPDETWLFHSTP